jgi:hypothetical protein
MSFEFCNVSTSFQIYIKSILQNYSNHFCTAYINDILIYSSNRKEHVKHALRILSQLKKKSTIRHKQIRIRSERDSVFKINHKHSRCENESRENASDY